MVATAETFEARGEATAVGLTHPEVIGGALGVRERIVHLSAFPREIPQSKRRRLD
ncbi:hypothetical protein [Thermosynechococcus sp. NK55a]|uniref:hypothetical protein n=1 Tax=Thermosynechococcus sp. NK55a TaxID=1394889 RepID=UPI000414B97F|nr:hypothetical protein [Thermosynechococcus sp. NK55a]